MTNRRVDIQSYRNLEDRVRSRFDVALDRARQAACMERRVPEQQRVFIAMLNHAGFAVPVRELTYWLREQPRLRQPEATGRRGFRRG
jgi:hypothetical protein